MLVRGRGGERAGTQPFVRTARELGSGTSDAPYLNTLFDIILALQKF